MVALLKRVAGAPLPLAGSALAPPVSQLAVRLVLLAGRAEALQDGEAPAEAPVWLPVAVFR